MGPQAHDVVGWVIVVIGGITTLATIVAAVKWTLHAGEQSPDHPKRLILKSDR